MVRAKYFFAIAVLLSSAGITFLTHAEDDKIPFVLELSRPGFLFGQDLVSPDSKLSDYFRDIRGSREEQLVADLLRQVNLNPKLLAIVKAAKAKGQDVSVKITDYHDTPKPGSFVSLRVTLERKDEPCELGDETCEIYHWTSARNNEGGHEFNDLSLAKIANAVTIDEAKDAKLKKRFVDSPDLLQAIAPSAASAPARAAAAATPTRDNAAN